MISGISKAGLSVVAWLILTLLWSASAMPQATAFRPAEAAASVVDLPDAPSASVSSSMTEKSIAIRSTTAQSWWLVAPVDAPFRPLTPHEKFESFVHHTISPYTFAGAVYDATWAQAWGDPHAYGGGMEGWGKRFGASVAGTETRAFFGAFMFPTLLHQDPRYFAMYKGPLVKRALHAVGRVFVTRDDNGNSVFNSAGMLSTAFTESLSVAWTPEGQRSAGRTFTGMLGAMQGEATGYVLREFTPDFLRLFKRHAPNSLRRIEEKIPAYITRVAGQP
ncbi:MAG: hypothetical protein ACXVZJ_07835 [Terriglobales bacterium]